MLFFRVLKILCWPKTVEIFFNRHYFTLNQFASVWAFGFFNFRENKFCYKKDLLGWLVDVQLFFFNIKTKIKYDFKMLKINDWSMLKGKDFFVFNFRFFTFSKTSNAQVGRVNTFHILQTIRKGPLNFKLCMKRPLRFSNF
jgi:hypothetical protein